MSEHSVSPETPRRKREAAQQRVRDVLLRFCEPKPAYTGVTAWEIAAKVLDAVAETDADTDATFLRRLCGPGEAVAR